MGQLKAGQRVLSEADIIDGNVELEPKRLNTVWVESEFLKLRARKLNKRRAK